MRELTSHKTNPANQQLQIQVLDEPGDGGAHHLYGIYGFHSATNPSADSGMKDETCVKLLFQNGPIPDKGVNGITVEALLAIAQDRLAGFQMGPFACRENALALTKVQEAMMWLHKRTRDREARGVEGTHEK